MPFGRCGQECGAADSPVPGVCDLTDDKDEGCGEGECVNVCGYDCTSRNINCPAGQSYNFPASSCKSGGDGNLCPAPTGNGINSVPCCVCKDEFRNNCLNYCA